jgi:hypothetical protein
MHAVSASPNVCDLRDPAPNFKSENGIYYGKKQVSGQEARAEYQLRGKKEGMQDQFRIPS